MPETRHDPFAGLPRIGMGCWAIGGPFRAGDADVGWSGTDDVNSRAALEAAWEAGIRVFDTADVYGAGHSETLLGAFLRSRPDAVVVSKFGHAFDPATKQMTGERRDPAYVRAAIDASRKRLDRDCVDVVLLHLNDLRAETAEPLFDALDGLRAEGWIGACGWSTDFPASVAAIGRREAFVAVEHAANVLLSTPAMDAVAERHGIAQLIRSPLAMGLLSGKYGGGERIAPDDVRNFSDGWNDWFTDRAATPRHAAKIAAIRDLLTTGGRTPAQGALSWLLAATPRALPVPGAKTAAQAEENAGALVHGPLPEDVMAKVERVLDRPPEGPPRAR
ncbi:MAG: aldo/keto reductase [Pseudomonadota bacterium]